MIDKENGGKADSLNAGMNFSHYPLVCAIDRNCRNQCQTERDCLADQVCDASQTCVDRAEVPDGRSLPDLRDGGGGVDAGARESGGSPDVRVDASTGVDAGILSAERPRVAAGGA